MGDVIRLKVVQISTAIIEVPKDAYPDDWTMQQICDYESKEGEFLGMDWDSVDTVVTDTSQEAAGD